MTLRRIRRALGKCLRQITRQRDPDFDRLSAQLTARRKSHRRTRDVTSAIRALRMQQLRDGLTP